MNARIKYLFLFFLMAFTVATTTQANLYKHSFRRCLLLPIQDQVGGAIGFGVFQDVENYLKNSDWCFYKHNSEILNILSNYRNNLDSHLENPDVLSILADKIRAGSIIRIRLKRELKRITVELNILADNGKDILFRNKVAAENDRIEVLSQTVKNWLDIYKNQIPYDGRVTGVLGNQFTIDIGKNFGLYQNAKITILRPTKRKKHPLLKEVVSFQSVKIAEGLIFHVNEFQGHGNVKVYEGKNKVGVNDWIIIDKLDQSMTKNDEKFQDPKKYSFGKIGKVGIGPLFSSGSATWNNGGVETREISTLLYGLSLNGELWLTREYIVGLSIEKLFGGYEEEQGTIILNSNDGDPLFTKLYAGYKYLPMGFFYGPQVDGYIGYKSNKYNFSTSDGFTSYSLSGLLVGAKGNVPLHKLVRMYLFMDFLITSSYSEDGSLYGEEDSSSNYELGLGVNYMWEPKIDIEGYFKINSTEVKFRNPTTTLTTKETSLGVKANFTF
ncbi:MAG: hypothetical protein ACPGJV_08200 [Bacteriovoracaceae bacterium]